MLSEYEKQVLADLEEQLSSQDPDLDSEFAEAAETQALGISPRRIAIAFLILFAGLIILLASVFWKLTLLGALGFVVMVGAIFLLTKTNKGPEKIKK